MNDYSATYSPEDNKLRFSGPRLDREDYERAKRAGFHWAPKQGFLFATWSPDAEDFALEFADEIEDEDKSLVERAEERAERFGEYSDNRAKESKQAHDYVASIADGIPLGQPILVGHHSERHARRDAKRIENGMRRAINLWDTAQYWKSRAAGAIRNAKYKELPAVRARRIKTLEAELRKVLRTKEGAAQLLKLWTKDGLTLEQGRWISGHTEHGHLIVARGENGQHWSAYDVLQPEEERYKACPARSLEEVQEAARKHHAEVTENSERWIEHLSNRLEYEHAMLEEQGATSLLDKKPKSFAAQLPLCNYRAPEGIACQPWGTRHVGESVVYSQVEMTQAEYAKIHSDYKGTRVVGRSHRIRTAMIHSRGYANSLVCVFLTDSKVHTPPAAVEPVAPPHPTREQIEAKIAKTQAQLQAREIQKIEAAPIEALRESLKTGVQVVAVNQLFPTPMETARYMCELADLQPGICVLEPSAGTGNIVQAILDSVDTEVMAYEINPALCAGLEKKFPSYKLQVRQRDFLEVTDFQGCYEKVIMNPPFENGADIKHIMHALTFLKPGGRLVAICANGPRQNEQLKPIADYWEELPADTFKSSGTGVRTALLTMHRPLVADTPSETTTDTEKPLNAAQKAWITRRAKAAAKLQEVTA